MALQANLAALKKENEALKSELDCLKQFEKTANDASWVMVETALTLSLGVKALEVILGKKELTAGEVRVLHGLDTMLRKIIVELDGQYSRIADHGVNFDKSRKETTKQAQVSA